MARRTRATEEPKCVSSCLILGKPYPFASEGFGRRPFSGGYPAAMLPNCRRQSAVAEFGRTAGFPPGIRRNIRRNSRTRFEHLPANCREVSPRSVSECPRSRSSNGGGHPAALSAQLPGRFPSPSRRMPVTDPNLIRQAAAQFQPRRRPRFGNLQPCREVIIELREKGASCEAIAELLNRYGVKTSRTMVNEFVRTLGRLKNGRRRKPYPNSTPPPTTPPPRLPSSISAVTAPTGPEPNANGATRPRGPHIAKVELLKPDEQHD